MRKIFAALFLIMGAILLAISQRFDKEATVEYILALAKDAADRTGYKLVEK